MIVLTNDNVIILSNEMYTLDDLVIFCLNNKSNYVIKKDNIFFINCDIKITKSSKLIITRSFINMNGNRIIINKDSTFQLGRKENGVPIDGCYFIALTNENNLLSVDENGELGNILIYNSVFITYSNLFLFSKKNNTIELLNNKLHCSGQIGGENTIIKNNTFFIFNNNVKFLDINKNTKINLKNKAEIIEKNNMDFIKLINPDVNSTFINIDNFKIYFTFNPVIMDLNGNILSNLGIFIKNSNLEIIYSGYTNEMGEIKTNLLYYTKINNKKKYTNTYIVCLSKSKDEIMEFKLSIHSPMIKLPIYFQSSLNISSSNTNNTKNEITNSINELKDVISGLSLNNTRQNNEEVNSNINTSIIIEKPDYQIII